MDNTINGLRLALRTVAIIFLKIMRFIFSILNNVMAAFGASKK